MARIPNRPPVNEFIGLSTTFQAQISVRSDLHHVGALRAASAHEERVVGLSWRDLVSRNENSTFRVGAYDTRLRNAAGTCFVGIVKERSPSLLCNFPNVCGFIDMA